MHGYGHARIIHDLCTEEADGPAALNPWEGVVIDVGISDLPGSKTDKLQREGFVYNIGIGSERKGEQQTCIAAASKRTHRRQYMYMQMARRR